MAALLGAQRPETVSSLFDKPIGEVMGNKDIDPVERLSVNQLLSIAALPPARIAEMKCAGLTGWSGAKDMPALALDEPQRKAFVDKVAAAAAQDTGIDVADIIRLIPVYADEPDYRKQQGEWAAYEAEIQRDCAPMIATVKAGAFEPSAAKPEGTPSK